MAKTFHHDIDIFQGEDFRFEGTVIDDSGPVNITAAVLTGGFGYTPDKHIVIPFQFEILEADGRFNASLSSEDTEQLVTELTFMPPYTGWYQISMDLDSYRYRLFQGRARVYPTFPNV